MTPYGIVYKDNAFALEHSYKTWQKKFGVMTASSLLKLLSVSLGIIIAFNLTAMALIEDAQTYFFNIIFMCIMTGVLVFIIVKNTCVRQMSKMAMSHQKKQAVLFDDRIEFTLAYSKSCYYYDEISSCQLSQGILTIILSPSSMPVSIYSASVEKGSFEGFIKILEEKLGSTFERKEGSI